jgi:serine/threonine protein kinase
MIKTDLVVFFSLTTRKWKVGDFGLAAEGFTEMEKTTLYGRGTQGYRAPELLPRLDFDAEVKSFYSKKSDIWALGCVFYEVAFSKQLFKQDISAIGWAMSGTELKLPMGGLGMDLLDPLSATRITLMLGRMLSPDPVNRQTANELCEQLGYCREQVLAWRDRLFSTHLPGFIIAIDFGTYSNQIFTKVNQFGRNEIHK